jgi:hypothetical protein
MNLFSAMCCEGRSRMVEKVMLDKGSTATPAAGLFFVGRA